MLRTKDLQTHEFDDLDPWSELLASAACAIYSTHHTTPQVTLCQLFFGRDMLSNSKFIADWEAIGFRKQKDIYVNNAKETGLRINNDYQIGKNVLITNNDID